MHRHPELICAFKLDASGGASTLEWTQVETWEPDAGSLWVHLDAQHPSTDAWLRKASGLNAYVIDGLLATETRPRCDDYKDGTLLILRGVNLNPGAEPEDMVSIRMWLEKDRLISTRRRHLMAVDDLRQQFATNRGAVSTGHLAVRIAARLTERMGPIIEDLSDQLADLEEQLVNEEEQSDLRALRHTLVEIRRIAISLRRYIAPQRDALGRLLQSDASLLDERARGHLRETVDRVTRIVEELDEIRERSAVVQDELMNRISQRMERTMYVLTLVATIMLPLGFFTGLLGINVGGIPGTESKWAFWVVSSVLAALVAIEIWLLKRLRWL